MLRFTTKVKPTLKWSGKVSRIINTVRQSSIVATNSAVQELKEEVAQYTASAFTDEKEIETLVKGEAVGGKASGEYVGSTEGGRFFDYTPLHESIEQSSINTVSGDTEVRAQTCNTFEINEKSRFKYQRADGGVFEAVPFAELYVQSVENGGVWTVVPRADNPKGRLGPERGKDALAMEKQVAPVNMFAKILGTQWEKVKTGIINYIKSQLRLV